MIFKGASSDAEFQKCANKEKGKRKKERGKKNNFTGVTSQYAWNQSLQKSMYTLHQKKVTFSSLIFPDDPRLGSVTLGHFQSESVTQGRQGKWSD